MFRRKKDSQPESRGVLSDNEIKVLLSLARSSLRVGRSGLNLSGQGILDVLLKLEPHLPIRSKAELEAHYQVEGYALGEYLVRSATRASAGVGAATGAAATISLLSPPTWLALPLEVVAETLVVAAIELRMIEELHNAWGVELGTTKEARAETVLRTWVERKRVNVEALGVVGPALSRKGITTGLKRAVRRRLLSRLSRNVSTLLPLFVGAVVGAEINRRATLELGQSLLAELVRSSK